MREAEEAEAKRGAPEGEKAVRSEPPEDAVDTDRPTIEVLDDTLNRLCEKPRCSLVQSGGRLAQLARRNGTWVLEQHSRESLFVAVADAVKFFRFNSRTKRHEPTDPPRTMLEVMLTLPEYPPEIATVESIVRLPFLNKDGYLVARNGLMPQQRVFVDIPQELRSIQLPETITEEDLAAAVATIIAPFQDFDLREDSVANLVAFLLTLLFRWMVRGVVPIFIISGNQPGTGKGLVCRVVSIIVFGRDAEFAPGNTGSDELRKRIFALASQGVGFSVLDNVESKLWSSDLAAWLTAPVFRDRRLGESVTYAYPNTMTFCATGNNLQIGGDIARRAVLIEIESEHHAPHERSDFQHADLVAHVRKHRVEILRAAYLVAAAWIRRGAPVPEDAPVMGSFEQWSRTMAGLLDTMGATGLLENRHRLRGHDTDAEEMALMLLRAQEAFGGAAFSARELAGVLSPDEIPSRVSRAREASVAKSLGHLLNRIAGRPYGDGGLVVRRCGAQVQHRWLYTITSVCTSKVA